MRFYKILLLLLVFNLPCVVSIDAMSIFSKKQASVQPHAFAPPPGKTILLIGQDRETIKQYVKETGLVPGGVMFYTAVQNVRALKQPYDYGAGFQDGKFLAANYPHSTIQIGLYMIGVLDDILQGKYDGNLRLIGRWIKKTRRPIYLRIGYEFDLPHNHYEPEKYKAVFRYIVNLFRRQNVSNVSFVWHSCLAPGISSWMDWYPGDEYVDWFGVSIFSTQSILDAPPFLKLARQHRKPFMIAESTPQSMYTVRGKLDWFKHIFRFIDENNVEAFCYINSNWDIMPMFKGQGWGDDRIEKFPEVKALWLNEIDQERYLNGSPKLFELLGWKK